VANWSSDMFYIWPASTLGTEAANYIDSTDFMSSLRFKQYDDGGAYWRLAKIEWHVDHITVTGAGRWYTSPCFTEETWALIRGGILVHTLNSDFDAGGNFQIQITIAGEVVFTEVIDSIDPRAEFTHYMGRTPVENRVLEGFWKDRDKYHDHFRLWTYERRLPKEMLEKTLTDEIAERIADYDRPVTWEKYDA
jgi:hypothetical protein